MRTCPQCGRPCEDAHKFCPACGFPIGQVQQGSDDPLIGKSLPGGYVILELVGIGGMGRVYRAEQTALGRTVAVKIVHPHLLGEETSAARFITEARAASRLNHPNSVAIIDFGKTPDGQLYLVMEFLRGKDLARVAYEEGPLPIRRIVDVLRQVLAALAEAHHLEIVHRDLKPENIILEPMRSGGDFVKVVDFGLAKMRAEASSPSITSPGIVCGTPEYMSPEQGRGDPLDSRSDLYSVGILLFQLLAGKLPFEGDSPTQVVLAHLTQPAPDPRQMAPEDREIPESIVRVTMRALSKSPDDRHATAEEFADDLKLALDGEGDRASVRVLSAGAVRCISCGAQNPPQQKFCGECGVAMVGSYQTPSPSTALHRVSPSSMPPPMSATNPTRQSPEVSERAAALRAGAEFPLPLIGREYDLGWLHERRDRVNSGLLGARLIGDAGIGKTRLLREFEEQCARRGDLVVRTGPDPAWAEVGYHALRGAIQGLASLPRDGGSPLDWHGATPEARDGLMSVFAKDSATKSRTGLAPEERRFAAAEALRWALSRAFDPSNGRPIILSVDDLHCVDGASRNALSDVIAEPPLVPALVVVAYAPGFDPGFSAGTSAARVLSGLPPDEVSRVLAKKKPSSHPSLFGGQAISPLYLDQLTHFLREQGGPAPARIADVIALRVERLPTDARRVLQAIAVFGDDATLAVIARMLSRETDMEETLSFLKRVGMIERENDEIRTAHPLIRDVVLATIPMAARRDLHVHAGEICEEESRPVEVRAMHEYFASNAFQALMLLERVSVEAASRGDGAGTVLALRRGLELARRELFRGELDDPMRAVLIFSRKLGEALSSSGALTDAEGVLHEALDMTSTSEDRARILAALARVAHGRERRQEAQRYVREALTLAAKVGATDIEVSLQDLRRTLGA